MAFGFEAVWEPRVLPEAALDPFVLRNGRFSFSCALSVFYWPGTLVFALELVCAGPVQI